jgi:hypothetical protein
MADGTHFRVLAGPGRDALGVAKVIRSGIVCACGNGIFANFLHQPVHWLAVRRVGGHIEGTGVNEEQSRNQT